MRQIMERKKSYKILIRSYLEKKISKKRCILKPEIDLMLPSMTFEVILNLMKDLCVHNVSNHRFFYQNDFTNKCARENEAKFLESQRYFLEV